MVPKHPEVGVPRRSFQDGVGVVGRGFPSLSPFRQPLPTLTPSWFRGESAKGVVVELLIFLIRLFEFPASLTTKSRKFWTCIDEYPSSFEEGGATPTALSGRQSSRPQGLAPFYYG